MTVLVGAFSFRETSLSNIDLAGVISSLSVLTVANLFTNYCALDGGSECFLPKGITHMDSQKVEVRESETSKYRKSCKSEDPTARNSECKKVRKSETPKIRKSQNSESLKVRKCKSPNI